MLSKSMYLQIIFRVALIVITTIGSSYLILQNQYILGGLLLFIVFLQAIFLIQYLNRNNEKIAFFFECLKNDDFTLHFSENEKSTAFPELHKNINALNKKVQRIYQQNKIQELYYEEILNQAEIGMLTFNKEGHILFANPRVEQLLNYAPLNHVNQLERVDSKLHQLFSKLEAFDRELIQLKNERGKIELVLKSKSILLNNEELLLVVIQDIHKELDEKETDSWLKLIRVLTHEIMNSVSPITSISESILSHLSEHQKAIPIEKLSEAKLNASIKGLEVIKDQGGALMDFVQSYRTFLNVPRPEKSLVSAQDMFQKIKVLQQSKTPEVRIETLIDPPTLEYFCDEQQVTQVLINLCKNAAQAVAHQQEKKIQIIGRIQENQKVIEVWDNGPGIPEELHEEIFIPFFTTKEDGTGVGLSLSRQIIRQHGGSLDFSSSKKKGTKFKISF